MQVTKKDLYISNAINSMSNCVSWGTWLACGMTRSVVLIDQSRENAKILQQFNGHQAIVTSISWISDDILISADDLSNIIIWKINPSTGYLLDSQAHHVNGLSASIVDIHSLKIKDVIYVICSAESNFAILTFSNNIFSQIHIKNCDPNFILAVNLIELNNFILIFTGLDNGKVVCNAWNINNATISESIVLSGHEDWITSLDSITYDSEAYLASSSQDSFIRIWKIGFKNDAEMKNQLDIQKLILSENVSLNIYLDGVLAGHENWVTQARFCDRKEGLMLMSSSMDKSVIMWTKNDEKGEKGQWVEETRLGEIGGRGLGFIGGDISRNGSLAMAFGYQGNMIVWGWNEQLGIWDTLINVGGHFDVVEDLAWDVDGGRYLATVSKDQTTRLHAPWNNGNNVEWHEIARPQIHGFDMTSITSVGCTTFVTGADEKICRVFGMNKQFNEYFKHICGSDSGFDGHLLREDIVGADALGLSNKTMNVSSGETDNSITDFSQTIPNEDTITNYTLWPEITKLYAHVFEVFRVSSHPIKKLLATTCKAQTSQYADIIIWNVDTWTVAQRLPFHKSTVVRVQFNKKGDRIVSVSKDRQWALWCNDDDSKINYRLVDHSKKPNNHSKIIWDVDWTDDDCCFATVSRDKRMMLWNGETCELIGKPLVFNESVNAIATMPTTLLNNDFYFFAIGLENGEIKIVQFNKLTNDWSICLSFLAHHDWITRLRFKPVQLQDNTNKYLLASCSRDRFVKIFEIILSFE